MGEFVFFLTPAEAKENCSWIWCHGMELETPEVHYRKFVVQLNNMFLTAYYGAVQHLY